MFRNVGISPLHFRECGKTPAVVLEKHFLPLFTPERYVAPLPPCFYGSVRRRHSSVECENGSGQLRSFCEGEEEVTHILAHKTREWFCSLLGKRRRIGERGLFHEEHM